MTDHLDDPQLGRVKTIAVEPGGSTPSHGTTACDLAIVREDDGSYSAIVLNLPGAGSCGATRDEAISNAMDAVRAVIASYAADNEQVPWIEPNQYSIPEGADRKRILMNV